MTPTDSLVHLEITARRAPELLERICRVLRHRGATVDRLLVCTDPAGYTSLDLTSRTRGDTALLVRQIGRLPDVHLVMVREGPLGPR
jgi:acetolactate synthase regulatory subunit